MTWAKEENVSIDTLVCPAQKIDHFFKEEFDAVICNFVLDHMTFRDASLSVKAIKNVLKPGGLAFLSFDGLEEKEERGEFIVLDDGTRKYLKGDRKWMLWRFYTNEEIKTLNKDMEILDFEVKSNGKREIWVRKK
jgi:2-polyprenyl-3-methyl-5-hydroxy-6-metoxy-1,4-benzoquinol methylase